MKTTFTFKKHQLLHPIWFAVFLMVIPAVGVAQTRHIVEASNYVFNPEELEIAVGDTVEWRNIEGSHNVNGTQETYPSNPESFGNDVGTDWVYSHVFNVAGQYEYQCDVHVAQGMTGTITVSETVAAFEKEFNSLKIYPNPVTERAWIETSMLNPEEIRMTIYDLNGKMQKAEYRILDDKLELDVERLGEGIYIIDLKLPEDQIMLKMVKK